MNHTVQHNTMWVNGWNPLPFDGNNQMRDADLDLLHGSWMFQQKSRRFSFKLKESGNSLHQCLVHVTFSSSPFNISIICGPPINQASSNFPKCLRFFTFLPSTWQLSHLDLSRPYGIFPPFSWSNPSYTALNYARTIFFDDDANSDACLNLISNRTPHFLRRIKTILQYLSTGSFTWSIYNGTRSTVQHIFT